jgi:hypothetical protein
MLSNQSSNATREFFSEPNANSGLSLCKYCRNDKASGAKITEHPKQVAHGLIANVAFPTMPLSPKIANVLVLQELDTDD